MRKIRKRVFAAVLAAALFCTMPGMAFAAEQTEAETETIQEPKAEDGDTDQLETGEEDTGDRETDAQEPAEEEAAPAPKEDVKECICGTLCTQDSINGDCPVCGAEDADLSRCNGEKTENNSENDSEYDDADTEEKIITAWEWIDPEEYLTDGVLVLPGASRRNPAFLADVTALLPEKIQAEVATVNVTEDGEEAETSSEALSEAEEMDIALTGWKCAGYPEGGAYEGVYTFYASLPEGFVLAEDAAALRVKVELGGAKMLAGEVSTAYQEASWNGSAVTYTNKSADCTPVTDSAEAVTWDAGWYVVNSSVTIEKPITVSGDVNLILADGCTLNATGLYDTSGISDSASAGIGGGNTSATANSGAITIHGGVIKATGGNSGDATSDYSAAGIGGGFPSNGNGGSNGTIVIYGGTITADSGQACRTGAGIGGGSGNVNGGAGSDITIYGGAVTASSTAGVGESGAGIGGGAGQLTGGTGSNIKIYGGAVTANSTGTVAGAGIGGGGSSTTGGVGEDITISGGHVAATGGARGAGIGGGGSNGNNKESGAGTDITISGGEVTAVGGLLPQASAAEEDRAPAISLLPEAPAPESSSPVALWMPKAAQTATPSATAGTQAAMQASREQPVSSLKMAQARFTGRLPWMGSIRSRTATRCHLRRVASLMGITPFIRMAAL